MWNEGANLPGVIGNDGGAMEGQLFVIGSTARSATQSVPTL
jgi:hypothetical protein